MPTIQKKLRAAPTSDAQICEKKKDPKKQESHIWASEVGARQSFL